MKTGIEKVLDGYELEAAAIQNKVSIVVISVSPEGLNVHGFNLGDTPTTLMLGMIGAGKVVIENRVAQTIVHDLGKDAPNAEI